MNKKTFKKSFIKTVAVFLILSQLATSFVFAAGNDDQSDSVFGKDYLLVVESGNAGCDKVDKIILKYQTTEGSILTQVMNPCDTSTAAGGIGDNALSSYQLGTKYYAMSGLDDRDDYTNIIKNIYHCTDTQLSKIVPAGSGTDYSKDSLFKANSIEYIRFTALEEINQILELDFVLYNADGGTGDWVINGISIYQLNLAADYVSVPYALASPSQAVIFSGRLIAHSDYDDVNELSLSSGFQYVRYILNSSKGSGNIGKGKSYYSFENIEKYETEALYIPENENTVASGDYTSYNVRIKISDDDKSGISSLAAYESGSVSGLRELLYASFAYTDENGASHSFDVPVITNSLLTFLNSEVKGSEFVTETEAYAHISTINTDSVKLFAQDGSSLIFTINIPNMGTQGKINSVSLKLDNSDDPTDVVKVEKIEIYSDPGEDARYRYIGNSYGTGNFDIIDMTLQSDDENMKLLYATDVFSQNIDLTNGKSSKFILAEDIDTYTEGVDYSNMYLVSITTSDIQSAGTGDEVFVSFDYVDTNGNENSTDPASIKDLCEGYYGTNYGIIEGTKEGSDTDANIKKLLDNLKIAKTWVQPVSTKVFKADAQKGYSSYSCYLTDVNYATHMQAGTTVRFPVCIDNLDKINAIKLSMKNASDQWQIEAINISVLTGIGSFSMSYVGDKEIPGAGITYRFITNREFETGETIYDRSNLGLLVQESDTVTIDISDYSITQDVTSRDYTDYYYSMEYALASSDLRLTTISKQYEIQVKVLSNTQSDTADDDTGSDNLFYFQLEFEKGTSGVVLANSQLASDGFRGNHTETFYISTTEDYGEVTSIRIIPDDVSEDSTKLDKLCIDSIKVIESSSTGKNRVFTATNVGWIAMEYVDNGNQAFSDGRSLDDLATIAKINAVSYNSTIEFTIAYDNSDDVQFVGDMYAEITYRDSDGKKQVLSNVSLAKNMYDYSRRTPRASVDNPNSEWQSDPETMFRSGSTDRFYVEFDDISSLESIKLTGMPENNTSLVISQISAKLVQSTGVLRLNELNEYMHSYEIEPELITDQVVNRDLPQKLGFVARGQNSCLFKFDSNTVSGGGSKSASEKINRVPVSINDTINLYIYMAQLPSDSDYTVVSPKDGNYKLTSSIVYSSVSTSDNYKIVVDEYEESEVDGCIVLSKTNISAKYLSIINYMSIYAPDGTSGAYIDHAVIQHVRANTVIDTVYVSLSESDAAGKNGVNYLAQRDINESNERQLVTLLFGEDSSEISLSAENKDIAVSLNYTASVAGHKESFTSENVFLSDSGTLLVKGGTLATFEFNEYGIDSIESITITSTIEGSGSTACFVEGGIIECYSTSDEEEMRTAYMSISPETPVDILGSVRNINVNYTEKFTKSDEKPKSIKSLKPVQITFRTMSTSDVYSDGSEPGFDSNGDDPIALRISYVDASGNMQTKDVDDIRKITAFNEGYSQGESGTINLLLKGVSRISSIQLNPYSLEDSSASWNLADITYSITGTSYSSPRTVNVYQNIHGVDNIADAEKFNLSKIVVKLTVSGLGEDKPVAQNSVLKMTGKSGQSVSIDVEVVDSLSRYGYVYKIEHSIDDARTTIVPEKTTKSGKISYTLPDNYTGQAETYIIHVASEESPQAYSEVMITVAPTVKESEQEQQPEVTEDEVTDDKAAEDEVTEGEAAEDKAAESEVAE